jgi:hypothetical protein
VRYALRSGSATLVEVESSSNLDGRARRLVRRGTVYDTLDGVVVQYLEAPVVGVTRIEWRIPLADGSQRGVLQSAAVGAYGDELTWQSPVYGDIPVAFVPNEEGYEEEPYLPLGVGYAITCRFIRLA